MIEKCLLALALCLPGQSVGDEKAQRPRNQLAPSLPQTTEEEEKRFADIIDRFIQYDTKKLTGAAGKKAVEDFNRLPAEAIFALIEGFNRAAEMEASCPAVVIGKKIQNILNVSGDLELLAYAKETVGVGVKAQRHQGMIRNVQFTILLRKGEIQRQKLASKFNTPLGVKSPASMSLAELTKAAGERGHNFKAILTEIEKRQNPKVYDILIAAAQDDDKDVRALGQNLLEKHVGRETAAQLKALLKHDQAMIRTQAIGEIQRRKLRWGDELIGRLQDAEEAVRQAARQALVSLSKGQDFGPERNVSFGDRETSVRRWREWWGKQR